MTSGIARRSSLVTISVTKGRSSALAMAGRRRAEATAAIAPGISVFPRPDLGRLPPVASQSGAKPPQAPREELRAYGEPLRGADEARREEAKGASFAPTDDRFRGLGGGGAARGFSHGELDCGTPSTDRASSRESDRLRFLRQLSDPARPRGLPVGGDGHRPTAARPAYEAEGVYAACASLVKST